MNRKIKNIALCSILLGTCATAGTVTAPNVKNINISGDAEIKMVSEKTDTATIQKRTAEVNLALEAEMENGAQFITNFQVYGDEGGDQGDVQAGQTNTDTGVNVTEAYAIIPVEKAELLAGLAPNDVYGTDAFEDGGEAWKMGLTIPVTKEVKLQVVSKIENEEEQDSNKGDTGETSLRIDATIGDINVGAKIASGYANKGDGNTPVADADKEKEIDLFTGYVTGAVAGVDFGLEYISKDVTMVGAATQPEKETGYFVNAGKEFGKLTAGVAYVSLTKGLTGGGDFAPGVILDGNVDSSTQKDTSAVVVPVDYAITDKVSANVTLISADVQGVDAIETDATLAYAMSENIELSATYGKFDGDAGCVIGDQTNVEFTVAINF